MPPSETAPVQTDSEINYSYATIKVTQSRIDKGLVAIPVGLADRFPPDSRTIRVYLDDTPEPRNVSYSALTSSTRECRIGGMSEWFRQNRIKSGDEIVVQFLDPNRHVYRLVPERSFVRRVQTLEDHLDAAASAEEASHRIAALTQWTQSDSEHVAISELLRLAAPPEMPPRDHLIRGAARVREEVPASLRAILKTTYRGHCQVCDFWFLKADGDPYFEIHHIDPAKGHHPKNVLCVCGNCHNQFEYATVEHWFSADAWLLWVDFNSVRMPVTQAILDDPHRSFTKAVFL